MKALGKSNLFRVREFLRKNKIDAILLFNSDPILDANIQYFTGFIQERGSYNCGLIIDQSKRILIVPSLEFTRAENQADVEEIVDVKNFDNSMSKAMVEQLKKCKIVGVDKSKLPLKFAERLKKRLHLKFVDIDDFLLELRSVKLKKEIQLIWKSAKITTSTIRLIEETLNEVAKGRKISEKQLAIKLEDELKRKNADGLAFAIIVGSCSRSAYPHPYPSSSEKIIKKGLGYVDFGAVYKGYHSDVTVPYIIGNINTQQKKVISITRQAYELAVNSIELNLPTWKLYEKVNQFIKSNNFELVHGLGHGIGLEIHEAPTIIPKPTDKLKLKEWKDSVFKENMTFTIEPGIYTKNFGCRLENDILIKKKKIKFLTNSNLIEV